MRKHLPFIAILLAMTFMPSCGITKPKATHIEKVKSNVTYKKENIDSLTTIKAGLSETNSKNYTEEVTYRTGNKEPQPIELTATFRVDTLKSFVKDTVIRLVDINDSNVSVSIYQNKKTNELTAKVTSKKGSTNIPFSELQIKRTFNEQSIKTDTTSKATHVTKAKVDSVDKTAVTTKDIKTDKDDNLEVWIVSGILFILVGAIAFLTLKPKSK